MAQESDDHGLRAQWRAFLKVLLDPWVLLLAVIAVLTARASLSASPPSAAAALTLVASVASGLLGGRAAQRWGSLTEEHVIFARGKGAVRSLKLHLGSVADLERRTRMFLAHCSGEDTGRQTFSPEMAFEEVVGRCGILQEQVLSSIENWTDIVPEADIKTQIGELSRLAREKEEQVSEVRRLQAELADSKNQSASTQERLQHELDRKETLLRETQRKLAESASSFGTFTGHTSASELGLGGMNPLDRKCSKCGKEYHAGVLSLLSYGNLCPDCRQNFLTHTG